MYFNFRLKVYNAYGTYRQNNGRQSLYARVNTTDTLLKLRAFLFYRVLRGVKKKLVYRPR